jgi:site-specific DNA-methyltransferase (adenine-specific)
MIANIYLGNNQAAFDSGKKWDLAIVDPPYGIDRNGMNMGNSVFNTDDKIWDKTIPDISFFNSIFQCSKNQIIWGGNYFPLPNSQYFAIWDKGETMYGRDFAECEYAWVSSGGTRIYKKGPNQLNRIHPTQKPIELYKSLLKNYAKKDETILDTHGGSMSSVIACIDMGFNIDVWELDPDYYYPAQKRIKNHVKQLRWDQEPPIINFYD